MIDRVLIFSLGGCAIFGTLLLLELTSSDPDQPPVVTTPAPVEAPAATRLKRPRIDELVATTLSRPLFSATRKPAEAMVDRPVTQELTNLRLTGIVIEPGRHLAIFASPGAKPLVRAEGETVDEWQVDSISPQQVSLSGPAGTTTMEPKTDPSIVRPAPAPQPAAASGQPAAPGRPSLPVTAGLRSPPVQAPPGSRGAPPGTIPLRPAR